MSDKLQFVDHSVATFDELQFVDHSVTPRWDADKLKFVGQAARRMPVSEEYLDYVVDQLGCLGPVASKRMFGGVGLYYDGLFFGLIAGDVLYFKVDDENRPSFLAAKARAFQPYGDDSYSMSYFEVPVDVLEDVDQLRRWARGAVAAAERKASSKKRKKR